MSYQGWTNYPTWCIHLWITNDESSYNSWLDEARTALEENAPDCDEDDGCVKASVANATHDLAERLKDSYEWQLDDLKLEGFWSDLVRSALSDVDWHEVAAALLEEVGDD